MKDQYVHLTFNFFAIGDQVCVTGIPENIFNVTGKKCIITDKRIWSFKYNPYVVFMTEEQAKGYQRVNIIPDCRTQEQAKNYFSLRNAIEANSQTELMCSSLGFVDIKLRHPRLYIYEDHDIMPNKIVVHTTGSDRTKSGEIAIRQSSGEDNIRILSDDVISCICKNYKNYEIVQVGSLDDKPVGGHSIDMRGKMDYWQTAKEIATCSRFIGVNSGPMHIANCYPKVDKRIVLSEFPDNTLTSYKPGSINNWLFSWLDPSNTYFNKYDRDCGLTYSYTKI